MIRPSTDRMRVILLYGGRSGEHEISLLSAAFVLQALHPESYEVLPVWIDHAGSWFLVEEGEARKAASSDAPSDASSDTTSRGLPTGTNRCFLKSFLQKSPGPAGMGKSAEGRAELIEADGKSHIVDFVFPVLHGTYGEDGRIQGYLDTIGVPYAGSGHRASVLSMDKIISRRLLATAGLPQPEFIEVRESEYRRDPQTLLPEICEKLPFPMFIKPANLGSSVGVSKARDVASLQQGIEEALRFESRLIVEQGKNVRELETAILGPNENPLLSSVGEVRVFTDFYSYDAKYRDPDAYRLEIPAQLSTELHQEVQYIVSQAYTLLQCDGYARADCFYAVDEDRIYFNEINAIPGFTRSSMFPLLWDHSGIKSEDLIDRIVQYGMERFKKESAYRFQFEQGV